MDTLLASGWVPVGSGGPAQFDEYGHPVPVDPPPSPFPEVKKKPPAIASFGPMAGLVEPNMSGQISSQGLDRDYHPDPMMPGTNYPAIPTPLTRQMQSLAQPGFDQTAERVPMPRPRPEVPVREADGAPSNAPTDVSSSDRGSVSPQRGAGPQMPAVPPGQPGMASPPASAPVAAPEGPSMFGRLGNFLRDNSNTFLALGAGFAGAPNVGQGISRASAAAIPASQADIKNRTLLQSQSSTYRALLEAGVPPNQALASIGNADLQKTLLKSYIEDRGKTIQMVKTKNEWGAETEVPYIVNKFPKEGEPMMTPALGGAGNAAGAAPGGNPTGSMTFAPGINEQNFDHSKVGEDYLNQYGPEMRAWVKNYLAGNGMPTGRQGSSQMIKAAAMKYGTDIGMAPDDASIGQRKTWANSLGNTQSGVGLQAKGFQQGLEHFVKLSDNLVKMGLSNGMGLEPVANWMNSAKNLTTAQQELVHKNDVIGQALAREMGNLFAKSGGGVHEAAETKKAVSNSLMSSKSAAGSLEAIDELMQGGLRTLEQRRDELFPAGNAPKGSNFLGGEQQAALEKIRHNIAVLKGEAPPDAAAPKTAAAAAPKPGRYRYDPQTGSMLPVQ